MDKKLSRRNILAATISLVPGMVLASAVSAAGVNNNAPVALRPGRLGMPKSAMLQIRSLDPSLSVAPDPSLGFASDSSLNFPSNTDTVSVPFQKVFGFREHTAIPAPYYFDVDLNKGTAKSADWNYTVNLYDAEGNDIGSITTSDGGTAIFIDQQAMFRVRANFD